MKDDLYSDHNKRNIKMNTPAIYQIKVQGSLNRNWSDSLSGMNITSYEQDGDDPYIYEAPVYINRLKEFYGLISIYGSSKNN
jgi:hypothetical protein